MNNKERSGIAVAGNILVDKINEINAYPQCGELTQILNVENTLGGCVCNVALGLKKISPDIDITAIGKIGNDDNGNYVKEELSKGGVCTDGIVVGNDENTSFTQVMSIINSQRTFFTYPGASSTFGYNDICFEEVNAKIFHLGYFMLLEKIDNGEGLTILKRLKQEGIETSIDLVSENSDRYNLVLPCLRYVDYLIINEYEAGKLTDIEPTQENIKRIAEKLVELGVSKKVIIHNPEFSVCLSNGVFTRVNSLLLPDGYIKGTTGAGDAFCSGALIGIYKRWSDKEILEFATECAAVSLSKPDATSGLIKADEIKKFCQQFSKR